MARAVAAFSARLDRVAVHSTRPPPVWTQAVAGVTWAAVDTSRDEISVAEDTAAGMARLTAGRDVSGRSEVDGIGL